MPKSGHCHENEPNKGNTLDRYNLTIKWFLKRMDVKRIDVMDVKREAEVFRILSMYSAL